MKKNYINQWIVLALVLLLLPDGLFCTAFADHDDDNDKHRYEKKERKEAEHNGKHDVAITDNPTYAANCGACHFVYQPGLLPSGSWDNILKGLSDHFGETVALDPRSMTAIKDYLKAHAADHSSSKLSKKIMKSIGSRAPLRVTQVPYVQRKHHEIDPRVFERESIGFFSNCVACHTTAEKGVYDDDTVTIPK